MEDIVAIKMRSEQRGEFAVLTWGRLFDPVDPKELIAVVLSHFRREVVTHAEVCEHLGEVSGYRYFFEGLAQFSKELPDYGKGYAAWKKRKIKNMKRGDDTYLLPSGRKPDSLGEGSVTHGRMPIAPSQ